MLPCQGHGGRASTDVTLEGLIQSVRAEEANEMVASLCNPGEVMVSRCCLYCIHTTMRALLVQCCLCRESFAEEVHFFSEGAYTTPNALMIHTQHKNHDSEINAAGPHDAFWALLLLFGDIIIGYLGLAGCTRFWPSSSLLLAKGTWMAFVCIIFIGEDTPSPWIARNRHFLVP